MMKNKGIIAINKPENWTSFDVVNKIKHILRHKYGKQAPKVGHLGTLDPMATGVLLVTVGSATKLFDLMQQKQKTYIASFNFDVLTDTLDSTGEVIINSQIIPFERDKIEAVLPKFIGKISQIPPKYSAKSVNGVRAYDLARKGINFELKPKEVDIYSINILEFTGTFVTLEITCGSGTYIRAIGRDIAKELGTVATMTSLVRTKTDKFSLDSCSKIQDINYENVDEFIIPINDVVNLPIISLNEIETTRILNGQKLSSDLNDGLYKLNDDKDTIALIEIKANIAKMSVFLG